MWWPEPRAAAQIMHLTRLGFPILSSRNGVLQLSCLRSASPRSVDVAFSATCKQITDGSTFVWAVLWEHQTLPIKHRTDRA